MNALLLVQEFLAFIFSCKLEQFLHLLIGMGNLKGIAVQQLVHTPIIIGK